MSSKSSNKKILKPKTIPGKSLERSLSIKNSKISSLNEAKVSKQNSQKATKCNQILDETIEKDLMQNKLIKELSDIELFLTDEEMNIKHLMESSLKELFYVYDEFSLRKKDLDSDSRNHFKEIRDQVEFHRQVISNMFNITIIKKLDGIALEMIERIKTFENLFMRTINIKYQNSLKSFCEEMQTFSKVFRDPNISLDKIKQIQNQTQEKSLTNIKSKLNEFDQIKYHVKKNEFKPQYLTNQNSFGLLYLFEYSYDPFKSQIMTRIQAIDLIKLCEFPLNQTWVLLYRASEDGFGAKDFHNRCDGHAPTLTIIKAQETEYIFGGYTETTWESVDEFKCDPNAFIFSLTNKESKSCKMETKKAACSIRCLNTYGPTFGEGRDIYVANNSNKKTSSYSNLGHTYSHPNYIYGSDEAKNFLAGSFSFQINEIEVYKRE